MSQLKIAVVGTGKVAENNYLPCLAAEADVELGYYNRTRSKADTCAARFGGQVFPTIQELSDWHPAAYLILTREMDRYDAANAILDTHPARLFFEKPLVARLGQEHVAEQDFEDAKRLLQRANGQRCQTAMVFNYRFFEHTQLAHRIVAERQFGKVLNVTGLVHYACWSHCIDLVHDFAGPLEQISALQGPTEHGVSFLRARDITAAFCTRDGATGTLIGTTTLAWDYPLFELTLNYEGGRVRMQDLDGDLEVMDDRRMEVERYHIYGARSRWDQYNSSFVKSVKAYLDSIRRQQDPPVPGLYGLLELQVEAGIKRSIAQGRPVLLDEDFPLL